MGRPPVTEPERRVKLTLRLPRRVVEHYRATGRGWQTRIADTLERIVARAERKAKSIVRSLVLIAAFALAGCSVHSSPNYTATAADYLAAYKERRAQRLAELEPLYGKCVPDAGWRSVSVIGKTTANELIRRLKACDVPDVDISRYVSANTVHQFVHIGTDRTWHFINGVLVSYRQ